MVFSGRPIRWSDHIDVSSPWRSVPKTGSRSNRSLYPTMVRPSSSIRTCQNAVLPDRNSAFPPSRVKASTESRIGADQYSS